MATRCANFLGFCHLPPFFSLENTLYAPYHASWFLFGENRFYLHVLNRHEEERQDPPSTSECLLGTCFVCHAVQTT